VALWIEGHASGLPLSFLDNHVKNGDSTLTATAMNRVDAWRMIQRRAAELGTRSEIGCHTFRATGITAYLEAGGTLENAQAMAAHESRRTTKLYDRTGDEITLDEVERITI
jgi:integrase